MSTPGHDMPRVTSAEVRFAFRDPLGATRGVRLWHENEISRPDLSYEFAVTHERSTPTWSLRLPRPDVDRLEYQLELTADDGATRLVCDPANPRRVAGPFGERSVVEFPEYRPPVWLGAANGRHGSVRRVELRSRALRSAIEALLWSSPGSRPGARLPLLIVHDGPEYAAYSGLLDMLDRLSGSGVLPPMRAALLAPGQRNRHYAASAVYARALVRELLPAVQALAPAPSRPVGMGGSLGALAMLHAHRRHPGAFRALFLQSGSYFRPGTDDARWDFTRGGRITRFVGELLDGRASEDPVPVTMTCGALEQNLPNNRAVCEALARERYDVRLHEGRDLHNWIAWRDALDPHLVTLLRRVWT